MNDHPVSTDSGDLNAYLDGALTAAEETRLGERLALNPALQDELDQLRATAMLLRRLPELSPRHSFTLGPEHARTAPEVSGVLRMLPITRSLSIAAAVAFMVVAGSLFFDINGGVDRDASLAFQKQDRILGGGVTEPQAGASDLSEDAPEAAAPAVAEESDTDAAEENGSSMTSRGDAASAGDEPMDDLTALDQAADLEASDVESGALRVSAALVAQVGDSISASYLASAGDVDEDRTSLIWSAVVLGGLALGLTGLWFMLAQAGRQSDAGTS